MKRLFVLFLCACSFREVPVAEQGLMNRHYELDPADAPVTAKKRCRHWDFLTSEREATAETFECKNEYSGVVGCYENYCDPSMCNNAVDIYMNCYVTHVGEWREEQNRIYQQSYQNMWQNQWQTPVPPQKP